MKEELLILIDKEIKDISETPHKDSHMDNYDFGFECGERTGNINAYEKIKKAIENIK